MNLYHMSLNYLLDNAMIYNHSKVGYKLDQSRGIIDNQYIWHFENEICVVMGGIKKYSHSAVQSTRIMYRDIGIVDSSMEKGEQSVHLAALPQSMDEIAKCWTDN